MVQKILAPEAVTGLASDETPQPVGDTPSAGTSFLYARADHVHEGATDVPTGNTTVEYIPTSGNTTSATVYESESSTYKGVFGVSAGRQGLGEAVMGLYHTSNSNKGSGYRYSLTGDVFHGDDLINDGGGGHIWIPVSDGKPSQTPLYLGEFMQDRLHNQIPIVFDRTNGELYAFNTKPGVFKWDLVSKPARELKQICSLGSTSDDGLALVSTWVNSVYNVSWKPVFSDGGKIKEKTNLYLDLRNLSSSDYDPELKTLNMVINPHINDPSTPTGIIENWGFLAVNESYDFTISVNNGIDGFVIVAPMMGDANGNYVQVKFKGGVQPDSFTPNGLDLYRIKLIRTGTAASDFLVYIKQVLDVGSEPVEASDTTAGIVNLLPEQHLGAGSKYIDGILFSKNAPTSLSISTLTNTGQHSVIIGVDAQSPYGLDYCTIIGYGSTTANGGSHKIIIGAESTIGYTNGIVIGNNSGSAASTLSGAIVIGNNVNTEQDGSILIGSNVVNHNGLESLVIGHQSTGASSCVILGNSSGVGSNNAISNTIVGVQSGNTNLIGQSNTFVGANVGNYVTTGVFNVLLGNSSGSNITTGSNNIVIGNGSQSSSPTVSNEVTLGNTNITKTRIRGAISVGTSDSVGAVGQFLKSNGTLPPEWLTVPIINNLNDLSDVATDNYSMLLGRNTIPAGVGMNTGLGRDSMLSLTTGTENTAIGYVSLLSNSTGSRNTAMGKNSLTSNTTGISNIAFGFQSLTSNSVGNYNTAIGSGSIQSNTTGNFNTGVGESVLYFNTTGVNNTAMGATALRSNKTGSNGVAIGYASQQNANNTITAWTNTNTSVGYQSLMGSSTPANNIGYSNTAIGYQALVNNSTGSRNTAVGLALLSNTTGNANTAMGYAALGANMTGYGNSAVGLQCLQNCVSDYNTAIGNTSLGSLTSGTDTIGVGYCAGQNITTGIRNVVLGSISGVNLTTGSNDIIIGYNATASSATVSNEITLGNNSIAALRCNVQTITSLSDERDKTDWDYNVPGIEFMRDLNPGYFTWQRRDGSFKGVKAAGFGAQSLKQVQDKHNATTLDLVYESNPEKLEARYSNLIVPMVKSIKDLDKENTELKNEINDLKSRLLKLEEFLSKK